MKLIAPDYYPAFHCIAGACRHSCCTGWEIDIDDDTLARYRRDPFIAPHIEAGAPPHFALLSGERCPFLNADGLCALILREGEDVLCQICRDHPRFRNYRSDCVEIGLGLVCEEAARLILLRKTPMRLVTLSDDGGDETPDEDERELVDLRAELLGGIAEEGPIARLREYLIYRHLNDALCDGRLEERLAFIDRACGEIAARWKDSDGSGEAIVEIARVWSYDTEYDDEVMEREIGGE